MENKKNYIDGVDVSGCEFSCENPLHEIKHSCNVRGYEKDNGLHIHLKCKNNPNCYYKQLQRLQAENEILKEKLQISQNSDKKTIEIIKENERLKEEKGGMQILINGYIELTDTYKKALQEIRAIAERAFVVCDDDCGNANRFTDILDKINEVIGAE